MAYNAWLQFLPEEQLSNLGLLTNGNFENPPSGLPFDWRMELGLNAVAGFVGPAHRWARTAPACQSWPWTGKFPELKQVVFLAPGHYRFEGKLRGTISAKRGLRWRLTCATGSHVPLPKRICLWGNRAMEDFRLGGRCASEWGLRGSDASPFPRFPIPFRRVYLRRGLVWEPSPYAHTGRGQGVRVGEARPGDVQSGAKKCFERFPKTASGEQAGRTLVRFCCLLLADCGSRVVSQLLAAKLWTGQML